MKPLLFKIRSARAPYAQRSSSSDLFGRGMDLALALLVFVLLGWAIDNWLGTKPLFIIVFAVLALVGGGGAHQVRVRRVDGAPRARARRGDARHGPREWQSGRMNTVPSMSAPVAGDAVELQVSSDMVKRGLIVGTGADPRSATSSGASTAPGRRRTRSGWCSSTSCSRRMLIGWAARISLVVLMAATMFGYLFRLGLIFVAVFVVKDAAWISLPALGAAIIVTHLGLLVWELRYVSISLAYPGLKPSSPSSSPASTNS